MAQDCPARVEALLQVYLSDRNGPDESFQAFTARHTIEDLRERAGARLLEVAA